MEITRHHDGALAVLTLEGRLTVTDAQGRLKAAALEALSGGAKHLILDLTAVPYVDSTRLGELISTHIAVSRQGGRMLLVCPEQRITSLLHVAGLDGVFQTFVSIADARQAIR